MRAFYSLAPESECHGATETLGVIQSDETRSPRSR